MEVIQLAQKIMSEEVTEDYMEVDMLREETQHQEVVVDILVFLNQQMVLGLKIIYKL